MGLLGLPDKELKALIAHADQVLTTAEATLAAGQVLLRQHTAMAEDLRAITLRLRAIVSPHVPPHPDR